MTFRQYEMETFKYLIASNKGPGSLTWTLWAQSFWLKWGNAMQVLTQCEFDIK